MRVIVAALDWGLGHATRCIPVIREFHRRGCEVLIAGSGDALRLLEKEFPTLRSVELPGYQPRYPRRGRFMSLAMAGQLSRFARVIVAEHQALENIVRREKIDVVISDNRYGCWSRKATSVFITHQNNILMPRRFGMLAGLVRALNEKLISRFHCRWIPDFPDVQSMAGVLAGNDSQQQQHETQYIGWLSRFTYRPSMSTQYDVTVILSGPEPQRTLFERIVLPQLQVSGLRYRVVRGLPSAVEKPDDPRVVNFMKSDELQACIEASDVIIARSGYSTVMDMHALGKKVIFVPTPGQTEQEYLARRFKGKGIAFYMEQEVFDLATALREGRQYPGFTPPESPDLLADSVFRILNAKSYI